MSATIAQVRRVAWLAIAASILGLAALALGCAPSPQDIEAEHGQKQCFPVSLAYCMPACTDGTCNRDMRLTCALLAQDTLRAHVRVQFPVMEGDEVCAHWKDIRSGELQWVR